jgi:ubiquinone biosynthesis protein UbiJ
MLNRTVAAALNHLLEQSGWALPRLTRFAGKTVRLSVAPFSYAFTIQADGMLAEAASGASADAECSLAPSLLPRLALQDEAAYQQISSTGDAALLTEIFFLSRNLRWDAAEDISHFTGDIVAERLVRFAEARVQHWRGAAVNISQALAEFWTEEQPLLAKPEPVGRFIQQVDALRDDVARLEQRIQRLAKAAE